MWFLWVVLIALGICAGVFLTMYAVDEIMGWR